MKNNLYTTITVSISYRDKKFFETKKELSIAVKLRDVETIASDVFNFSLLKVSDYENPSA